MALIDDLATFFAKASRTPFKWGTFDCCLWLADWCVERGWPDPAASVRGTYCSEAECEALFGRFPAVRASRQITRYAGIPRTGEPGLGDIGVVSVGLHGTRTAAGAIHGTHGWVLLGGEPAGVLRPSPALTRCIAAWKV